MTARARGLERALLLGVLGGVALLLLTPFVVSPGTIYPYVVGKALWSRAAIEVTVALWALLAIAQPKYRPPRSWLLALLWAGLAVALLAACFGVGVQRSLWSTYERMQGVVDGAHWCAIAVVLASVLRTARARRGLLAANVVCATVLAGVVVALRAGVDVPFYAVGHELALPRMFVPLGNPAYLGAYLLVNAMLAAGFAVRAGAVPAAEAAARPAKRRGRGAALGRALPAGWRRWSAAAGWAAAAGLQLAGVALAGSVGAFAGLFGALVALAVAGVVLLRGWRRWAAAAALAGLAVAAVAVGVRFVDPDRSATARFEDPVVRYVAEVHLERPSVQSRLAAWEAALEGLRARPLLGWGPENFIVVFGRFASGYGATAEPHDQAHGELLEVGATEGVAGLAAYVALWLWMFVVVWRAVRRTAGRERVLAVFVGATLAGVWVVRQFLFDTTVGSLQTVVLVAFVVGLEAAAFPGTGGPRLPRRVAGACAAALRRRGARVALGAAVLALAGAGLEVHRSMAGAGDARHLDAAMEPSASLAVAIEGFAPMANGWRWWVAIEVARSWARLRAEDRTRAAALLEWAAREVEESVRTEPQNWQLHTSAAWLYGAAAATDPAYTARALRFAESARALAPHRALFPRPLPRPEVGAIRRLDGARRELHWRGAEGAGYHQLAAAGGSGRWRPVLYSYDPARTSFVAPAPEGLGPWRYRIKACRHPGECTAWAEWPAPPASPGESR